MYINFYKYFGINKKSVRTRSSCLFVLEEWVFLDHTLYVFVDEMVIKIFIYHLLIMNPALHENIVNLFEHDMET